MLPTIKKGSSVQQENQSVDTPPEQTAEQAAEQTKGRRITLKKVLYHPLTWLAIGFHVLLLVVPFGGGADSDLAATPEEETDEAIPVDLLNLSDIATSTPPPAETPPAAAPPPPPTAAPPAQPPPPSPSQAAAPEPAAAPPTEVAEPAAAPVEPAAPDPVAVPQEAPPPAYDPAQDQSVFIANLGAVGLNDYTDQGLPTPNFFRNPENAGYFLNGDAPAQGAASARWVDKSPNDVLAQLQTSYAPTGIAFTKLDDYAGEMLYQLTTPTGETFMHVSLVRLKGSTLLVIWQDRPV